MSPISRISDPGQHNSQQHPCPYLTSLASIAAANLPETFRGQRFPGPTLGSLPRFETENKLGADGFRIEPKLSRHRLDADSSLVTGYQEGSEFVQLTAVSVLSGGEKSFRTLPAGFIC